MRERLIVTPGARGKQSWSANQWVVVLCWRRIILHQLCDGFVQILLFSAMAYSPRLVLWISRDPFMWHAVGVFTATFLYALAALSWVDRDASGKVPFVSSWVVLGLLLASVAMFIGLIQRVGLLQINRMLNFTGDQGRKVIEAVYPRLDSPVAASAPPEQFRSLPLTQTLRLITLVRRRFRL